MSEPSPSESVTIFPHLSYSLATRSGQRQEPDDYLLNVDVKILGDSLPEDQSRTIHLGDLRATLIRVTRAYEEGFPVIDLFDHSQEIYDFGSALFEPTFDEYVEPVRKAFPEAFPHEDILFIRGLTVHPIARGQRVGISALHRFMTDWESGCSLLAIQSVSMQFSPTISAPGKSSSLSIGDLSENRGEATAKLEDHFRGIGFTTVGGLPYMLQSPTKRQAPLEELALEDSLTISRHDLKRLQGATEPHTD